MNGSIFYGPKGRLISALAMISAFIGALQASGILMFLPPEYAKVGLVVTAAGLLIAGFSERIQGGASKPEIREAAKTSDEQNAIEEINKENQ